jgi:NAD(P)-dependent dehydrogenase (short-subunit alcohol dehydrogenase family)
VADRFSLEGHVALVTGASSGIGARCARVVHDAGAEVVVVARRRERLDALSAQLERSHVIAADLSDPDASAAVVGEVGRRLGRLDLLVNAAGVTNVVPAHKEVAGDFRRVLDVNLLAPFLLSQAAVALMRETEGGSIVNITSVIAGLAEPTIPQASYAASKGGLANLTRELAVQWARYGVRVNAVAPGWFPTEMTAELTDEVERSERFAGRIPMGRFGSLEELDGAVLLLASPAGSYITGQTITVDGGTSLV